MKARLNTALLCVTAICTLLVGAAGTAAAITDYTFTYQGQMLQSGTPMNGTADMVFKLYSSPNSNVPLGQVITANGVPLTNGRFTIPLDFTNGGQDTGVLEYDTLYLEITVNGIVLAPREKLTASPFAVYARRLKFPLSQHTPLPAPLEIISDADFGGEQIVHSVTNSTKNGATAVLAEAPATTGVQNYGVRAVANGGNGIAVLGTAGSFGGTCIGVQGITQSTAGIGLSGLSQAINGTGYGVYGKSNSPDGYGGYFDGRGYFQGDLGVGPGALPPAAQLDIQGYDPSSGLVLNANGILSVNGLTGFVGLNRGTAVNASEVFGIRANVTGHAFGGMYIDTSDPNGIPYYGYGSQGVPTAWTSFDPQISTWRLHVGADRINVSTSGLIGLDRLAAANALELEGNASKTVAGSWLANSDARIKTDVATIDHALDTLDRVRLVSFRYTDDYRAHHPSISDHRYVNVIAQEFRQVFPDNVTSSGEKLPAGDNILQVDTYPLTIYSAAAVQELHQMVERQGAEIAELRAQVERLEHGTAAAAQGAGSAAEVRPALAPAVAVPAVTVPSVAAAH